jgi:hypothetical protein
MNAQPPLEPCPRCGDASAVRPKLLLIDEAWVHAPGKDPRLKYFADLRVDDVAPEHQNTPPLAQFVDGCYCDKCGHAFVPTAMLNEDLRRYR